MRKIILFFSVCSIMISGCNDKDSKVMVEIPDAKFKTYLLENFDKNADGELSLSEAKSIKDINCSGMDIAALDGIEKFANLESLDCRNNDLSELEIRYNKKLNKLVCTGNKTPLTIYIGMTSLLKNKSVKEPTKGKPQMGDFSTNPLDDSKCTYDHDKTRVMVFFDD